MIPEPIIDEIRTRADIVEVVGEQVPLKRAGKDFRALCPFHHEKTPSFYVVPHGGFYKCFGCGESGDVFTFLMKRSGISFQDAVRELGAKYGVDVPDPRLGREEDEPHRLLYEAVSFAHDHFREQLTGSGGDRARRYLAERGIPDDAVERFGLGYAPDAWRTLREAAHRHGIEDDVLLAAGLIKESERSEEPYDRFRDRLIFPIANLHGRVVAFGGRILSKSENAPKYLNSPETPIYHKGDILYGLNWSKAAIRRAGAALVVEGYMDYVSLAGRGIEHVVAGMGTALTDAQANLLARYTGKALMLYDSDAAGLRAAFRSADVLLKTGVHPLVVTLPQGEDPDSLVRRGGAAALQSCLDDAVDVVERKIQMLEERGFFDDIEGVRRALDRLLPTLRATVDPALRDIYTARIAQRTGVRRETLERDLERKPASNVEPRGEPRARAARPPLVDRFAAERMLLKVLIADRNRIPGTLGVITPDHLRDVRNREILERLQADPERDVPHLSSAAQAVWDELVRGLAEIMDAGATYAGMVDRLQLEQLDLRDRYLESRMDGSDDLEQARLLGEKAEINRMRQKISDSQKNSMRAGRRFSRLLEGHSPHAPEPLE
jgi:DNA primase